MTNETEKAFLQSEVYMYIYSMLVYANASKWQVMKNWNASFDKRYFYMGWKISCRGGNVHEMEN